MKKLILILMAVVLLAAACSKQPAGERQNSDSSQGNQQATSTPNVAVGEPSPSPTPAQPPYKIYNNTKYKFSVEYPSDAVVRINDPQGSLEYSTQEKCKNVTTWTEEPYKGCEKVAVWVDQVSYAFGDSGKPVTIGGLDGQMYLDGKDKYTQEGWNNTPHIGEYMGQVERGGNWYKFSLRFYWDEKDQAQKEYTRLLSSFKFTAPLPAQSAVKTPGWQLARGDVTDTCTNPTFTGKAVVHGWYVWEMNYVEKQWMLRVADGDLAKLPIKDVVGLWGYYQNRPYFAVSNPSSQLEDRLKWASKENPVELTVVSFSQYCEGSAVLKVQE